jgi:hypothetical protein
VEWMEVVRAMMNSTRDVRVWAEGASAAGRGGGEGSTGESVGKGVIPLSCGTGQFPGLSAERVLVADQSRRAVVASELCPLWSSSSSNGG